MREGGRKTPVDPGEEPRSTVGKPYKLSSWRTVSGNIPSLRRTLCSSENRPNSTPDWLGLFDSNRRMRYEAAPSGHQVPYLGQLAKLPSCHVPSARSLACCLIAFRTARWLVRTTFSRGKDDHHRDPFLGAGGEIYFWRSEFWTEERRGGKTKRTGFPDTSQ